MGEMTNTGRVAANEVAVSEYLLLRAAQEMLSTAESSLEIGNFGVVQGALRGVFNGVGRLASGSSYLSGNRIRLLEEWNDGIFKLRDDLVTKVEVENQALEKAAESIDFLNRLGKAKSTLNQYMEEWYIH